MLSRGHVGRGEHSRELCGCPTESRVLLGLESCIYPKPSWHGVVFLQLHEAEWFRLELHRQWL